MIKKTCETCRNEETPLGLAPCSFCESEVIHSMTHWRPKTSFVDINEVRKDYAQHLLDNAHSRYSADAAMMHVVEKAFRSGYLLAQTREKTFSQLVNLLLELDLDKPIQSGPKAAILEMCYAFMKSDPCLP